MSRRTAVLVIAAVHQPVYIHYIQSYWTELIEYTNSKYPDLDVFLLIENGLSRTEFAHLGNNVIEDPDTEFRSLVAPRHRRAGVPGILSKTIHALEVLQGDYDLFFRTNLSSMINVTRFRQFVQANDEIGYSGAWVWDDGLRSDLIANNWVGAGRIIEDLSELDNHPGNTFFSGSGFFLNASEAASLTKRRGSVRWDLADDVSVGLMFDQHQHLPGFSTRLLSDQTIDNMMEQLRTTTASHARLEHFPAEKAAALWQELKREPLWR